METPTPGASSRAITQLKFQNFSSCVDVSFWHTLSQKKLEEFKLSTSPVKIIGTYGLASNLQKDGKSLKVPARVMIDEGSFRDSKVLDNDAFLIEGLLMNANTVEDFKAFDKRKIIQDAGSALLEDIKSGACTTEPSKLNKYLLLTYANLKTHRYVYWFAFPALCLGDILLHGSAPKPVTDVLKKDKFSSLLQAYSAFRAKSPKNASYFAVTIDKKTGQATISSLSDLKTSLGNQTPDTTCYFGFADPSTLELYPGWPLRNYLAYIHHTYNLESAQILCLRDTADSWTRGSTRSILIDVQLTKATGQSGATATTKGWEMNVKGRPGARMVDLKSVFDPKMLAKTSADLNLKLMRWRSLPSLDTELLGKAKCLMLGSGTLGCNVARTLLGWGIRHITFVDNGRVSYSNPVRQPLFDYEDSIGGKSWKAETAARNLKKICPSMVSEGHNITIPMPGHRLHQSEIKKVTEDCKQLESLIVSHDLIFLLTDSRESRWLPSVMCAAHGKRLINAALGFDTLVVMRHGVRDSKEKSSTHLGCYFCNDVVAPTDSLSDRTLDQQCTVTRPGGAPIASALAAELAISVLQLREVPDSKMTEGELGIIPHQIRGSLRKFELLPITGNAFDKCTACSDAIVQLYLKESWKFVFQALNDPKWLEDISGLTAMKQKAEALLEKDDWELDD
ncbi:hypothetical protein AAMO2058_001708100 [Amorphochlora amoebiformis]